MEWPFVDVGAPGSEPQDHRDVGMSCGPPKRGPTRGDPWIRVCVCVSRLWGGFGWNGRGGMRSAALSGAPGDSGSKRKHRSRSGPAPSRYRLDAHSVDMTGR
eukprot:5262431-Pyramimonas_sp.AAC.1